ncbi:uncharacterized protein [Anabrus simplex]|uniref:uncharacterized protein isoform X2 n=1 Tax=Anabrus simplex TaxID=316456 RepID=UPI0035A27039
MLRQRSKERYSSPSLKGEVRATYKIRSASRNETMDCSNINFKEDCYPEGALENDSNSSIIDTDNSYHNGVLDVTVKLRRMPGLLELRSDSYNNCRHIPLTPYPDGGVVIITNLREASYSPEYISVRVVDKQWIMDDPAVLSSEVSCKEYYNNRNDYVAQAFDRRTLRFSWMRLEKSLNLTNFSLALCKREANVTCLSIDTETQEVIFSNLTTGLYYLKIDCGFCYYESNNYFFSGTDVKHEPIPFPVPSEKDSTLTIGIAVFVLILLAIAFFTFRQKVARRRTTRRSEESPEDTRALLPVSSTVLLLYSHDSGVFDPVINVFKVLLERMDLKVIDPLDTKFSEDIAKNPPGWLVQHLNSSTTKVVFVLTDGAVVRQKALLNNMTLHFCRPHPRDGIFTYALQYLHENPQLSRDYNRVFTIRFSELTNKSHALSLIVPLKCFALLDNLSQFHHEIQGYNARPLSTMEELRKEYSKEIEDLEHAVTNVKNYLEANPNWLTELILR